MTFGSLFSGIGGFDLGLERAGWECRWQVEIDPFCRRVLARHWPGVTRHGDIRTLDLERLEPVDLICGGFPCQPVSQAGKRLAQADARWLWPEFARVIRALRPRFVLVENVPGLLGRGFGDVLGDLAASGYDAEWDCIPASAVGAPHRRDRLWLLAYADGRGCGPFRLGERMGQVRERRPDITMATPEFCPEVADADGGGCDRGGLPQSPGEQGARGPETQEELADTDRGRWNPGRASGAELQGGRTLTSDASEPMVDANRPGLGEQRRPGSVFAAYPSAEFASWWRTEPDVGRVAHGIPQRVDRLRGLGNAIVPQIAEWIGRRLMAQG